jgi:hypothetical protein
MQLRKDKIVLSTTMLGMEVNQRKDVKWRVKRRNQVRNKQKLSLHGVKLA